MPPIVQTQTYVNRKGESRLTALMPRSLAIRVALGEQEAIDLLTRAIRLRIEREESTLPDPKLIP